jgi:hypothetical protein
MLAHKLRDRYQLPIKICIYLKSNALITSEDISVIVENFWKNFGKSFLAALKFKFKEIRLIFRLITTL